jgi:hypothetical protein
MMTIDELRAKEKADHAAYESRTVVGAVATATGEVPVTIADLRVIFDMMQPVRPWKDPIDADMDIDRVPLAKMAVEHFHGRKATTGKSKVNAADPRRVRVQSKGYAG